MTKAATSRSRKSKTTLSPTTPVVDETVPTPAQQEFGRTKLAIIVELLSRPEGASVIDLVAATGWQAHSVRGALAGSLKKKGYVIGREMVAGQRRYRIEAAK